MPSKRHRPRSRAEKKTRILVGDPAAARRTLGRLVQELDRRRRGRGIGEDEVRVVRLELSAMATLLQYFRHEVETGELAVVRAMLERAEQVTGGRR